MDQATTKIRTKLGTGKHMLYSYTKIETKAYGYGHEVNTRDRV